MISSVRQICADERFRQLLRWCIPAVLVGFALRAAVTICMPYGYLQYDSADFLHTPYELITRHHLAIHSKRSFVTPLTFTLPFILHIPALIAIPIGQHLMGLVEIVMSGALVRLWFRDWKWFIVPITTLIGASPWMIWYEHTLMGEAQYLFFTIATVLTGTFWAQRPSRFRFIVFCLTLFLANGTRSEAKSFFAFALALAILVLWKRWRPLVLHGAALAAVALLCQFLGSKRDISGLLYASAIQYAPSRSAAVPEVNDYIAPIIERWHQDDPDYPAKTIQACKRIQDALDKYRADERGKTLMSRRGERNDIFRKLIVEILQNHPVEFLALPLTKLNLAIDAWSSYAWSQNALHTKQKETVERQKGHWISNVLSGGLTGKKMTLEQMLGWIDSTYNTRRIGWFMRYQKFWNRATIRWRLPDHPLAQRRWAHDFVGGIPNGDWQMPGVPWFYLLALSGMGLAMIVPDAMRRVHIAWVPTMLGTCYLAAMIGVTNARFRFAYEPFCLVYCCLLIANTLAGLLWLRARFSPVRVSISNESLQCSA